MKTKKKKVKKAPSYDLQTVLNNFNGGEAAVIGLEADMGNERAEAVIAQYVWYLKHQKDPERIRLLCVCYERYKKAKMQ